MPLIGIATVTSPFIGGTFTSLINRRWCSYIDFSVGTVSIVAILLLLSLPENEQTKLLMTQLVA